MKRMVFLLTCIVLLASFSFSISAHSGRTDGSGGHNDNKNASGLGSYHYHHGYGPHLHPGGVCPYANSSSGPSTGSSNTGGSSAGSSSTSGAPDSPQNTQATISLTAAEQRVADKAAEAIRQAKSESKTRAIFKLEEETELTLNTLKAISDSARSSGMEVLICRDILVENAVVLRLELDPGSATKAVCFLASLDNEQAARTREKFQRWYRCSAEVISLEQAGDFGASVSIIAKTTFKDSFYVYSYNANDNTYTLIPAENCSIDDNGYIHIKTSIAGEIVIMDRPITK